MGGGSMVIWAIYSVVAAPAQREPCSAAATFPVATISPPRVRPYPPPSVFHVEVDFATPTPGKTFWSSMGFATLWKVPCCRV